MEQYFKKVAVLGSGVMGSQIAAHLANVGIPSLLFDVKQDLAEEAVKSLQSLKPNPLYQSKNSSLIETCNYDKHLEKIYDADWVIEVVAEDLEIKHALYNKISPYLKDSSILTSNTSGIPLKKLSSVLKGSLKNRFMITHFFNPPRYMKLLELVKGTETDEVTYDRIATFATDILGKGIVHAKDTPNFIANRIGVFGMMVSLDLAKQMNLTVEEVDKITGTIVGRPKSATFRTADVVGLDTLANVLKTSYDSGNNDEERNIFKIPSVMKKLIDSGRLGQKTRAGFYQKTKKSILSIDLSTGKYGDQKAPRFDGYRIAKDRQLLNDRIIALSYSDDKAGKYFWKVLTKTLIYSANRIPEISDDIINIDNAMRWGFGWELGPFETWDVIGVSTSVLRMKNEGQKVPVWVQEMLDSGRSSFYEFKGQTFNYYDPIDRSIKPKPQPAKNINLKIEKLSGNLIKRHWSASLIDIGDDIINVEFHSILQPKLNPLDGSMTQIIQEGLELIDSGKFKGMVLGHQGSNFSAGANLAGILDFCENKDWIGLEKTVKLFQDLTQKIRFSNAPVVAAPFQLTLGGGFEFIGPAAHRVSSSEIYVGAVEVGVGLIPGAGGNLRLLLNLFENLGNDGIRNSFQASQKAFETIAFAKVATSADEAKSLGYLLESDTIVFNDDHRIWCAKQKTIELAEKYTIPHYRDNIKLPGEGGRTAMRMAIKGFKTSGKISSHDELIANKLAYVLTGGDKGGLTKSVDEQYLLDIEREAFVSLAGEKLTQDRIRYMLKKGKPLRN